MRNFRTIFVAATLTAVVFSGATASAATGNTAELSEVETSEDGATKAKPVERLSELVAEYRAARRDWWERGRHMEATDESHERAIRKVLALDDLRQRVVEAAFRQSAQFDDVRRSLAGLMDFRETPRDFVSSPDVRRAMLQAQVLTEKAEEMPSLVYYQHVATTAERGFLVLHNMTPAWWEGVTPISHAIVAVANGKTRYYRLPEVKNARSAVFFVDLFEEPVYVVPLMFGDTSYPDIACVKLHGYRNDSCRLYAVTYDDANDEWDLITSRHISFPDWAIQTESKEFRPVLREHTCQGETSPAAPISIDLREWFRAAKASWLARGRTAWRGLE